jgi:8-oxo-dGTP diphosphatase
LGIGRQGAFGDDCPPTFKTIKKMYTYKYPHPAVAADCVVLVREAGDVKVLLIERKNPPYQGCWAFPGGFMNIDETTDEAARRELAEETGLKVEHVEQVGAYSKVDRDPRERVISVTYLAWIDKPVAVKGDDDARKAQWFSLEALPQLAFDHKEILADALRKAGIEKWSFAQE